MTKSAIRKSTRLLWIFCEGETEKYYFQKLKSSERISRINIRSTNETGSLKIVEYAIDFINKSGEFEEGDRVYCVFDRNSNTREQLLEAKRKAKDRGIEMIFSNPSFEFWLLLHFIYYSERCENEDVMGKLLRFVPRYKKADPDIYSKTKTKIGTASLNAKKVMKIHSDKGVEIISKESNPVTNVFELIDVLNTFDK